MTSTNLLKVIYRIGGTLRFEWREIFTRFETLDKAELKRAEIAAMGYDTKIVPADALLPTTFTGEYGHD